MTLAAIASDYIRRFRVSAARELDQYRDQGTLAEAIWLAALSKTAKGKRHPHQCRLPQRVLEKAELRLQAVSAQLERAKCFGELHRIVATEIAPIRGIGPLAVYDIAHRIGAYLGLEPDAVYLHAGTRQGAAALGLKGEMVALAEIPSALRKLSAAEIEDCFCIYKDVLRGKDLRSSKKMWCALTNRREC